MPNPWDKCSKGDPPPGPSHGSEALLGLGGRGHAAVPAARPWVSIRPHGRRCPPHLPAGSRETSRGEVLTLPHWLSGTSGRLCGWRGAGCRVL